VRTRKMFRVPKSYFVSLCSVCFRQNLQNFFVSIFSCCTPFFAGRRRRYVTRLQVLHANFRKSVLAIEPFLSAYG